MKKCYKCGKLLNKREFNIDPSKKCGLHGKCKKCCAVYDRNRRTNIYGLSYGLSKKRLSELSKKQNYCCAICGIHEIKLKRRLSIDHSHKTGLVRGLLCNNCNLGIGLLGDSIDNLKSAIKYLG